MSGKPIKVALAGAGAFGIKHLDGIRNIDGVEVVSLVSRELEKTKETAAKYGIPLVDLEPVLGGTARRELFWDTMHPSLKGHQLIAEAIARTVREIQRAGNGA